MSLPLAYQTQLHQLAVGFEPIDQLRSQRTAHPLAIEVERPEGVTHRPNNGYADISYQSDIVPRVGRGEYGTHSMLYLKRNSMPDKLVVRIRDDHRRYVPRRFRLDIPAAVNADTVQRPLSSRKQSPLMFPGRPMI